MTNLTNNPSAFPRPVVFDEKGNFHSPAPSGMTLRDYFAAKSLQGLLSQYPLSSLSEEGGGFTIRDLVCVSYDLADDVLLMRGPPVDD